MSRTTKSQTKGHGRHFATKIVLIGIAALFICAGLLHVMAATNNKNSHETKAKISFTFDDGYTSSLTEAAPTLARYGYTGTNYVVAACVNPSNCRADNNATYMTWDEILQLKNTYGWEIGSHTATHPYLASTDPEDQPNELSLEQVTHEIRQSKQDLAAHGIDAQAFASPYGDYDVPVLAEIAKEHSSQRGFADIGYNIWPYSDYFIEEQQVQAGVSVDMVKGYIDTAIREGQWLVLVFHDIRDVPYGELVDYEYYTNGLEQIAAYAQSKGMENTNISNALVTSDVNLLPNATFNNGIAEGWATDNPAVITADSANNGSYPDPQHSIKLTSADTNAHLFSPKITVDPHTTYLLKTFLHIQSISSGSIGFYIDEYDADGNWISGQYKTDQWEVFAESVNFDYKPSSTNVATASLQVIVVANGGIVAYVDNIQWFPVSVSGEPIGLPTTPILHTTFNDGLSNGWYTDDTANITATTAGENPASVIKTVARDTGNNHLFSPSVAIEPDRVYNWITNIELIQISDDEIGFYIDEYDADGNWISGQYKGGVRQIGPIELSYEYWPTSDKVAQIRLQIISVARSNAIAYINEIFLHQL